MIVDYINSHQAEFWIAAGFLLLVLEVAVMGLSTGVLLFGGLGALITGLLMSVGIINETWTAGVAGTGICTGIITGLLWVPFKRLQKDGRPKKDNSSDFIGMDFVLDEDISQGAPVKYKYSGVEWRVEIDRAASDETSLSAGSVVEVTSVDAGIFRVKPAS